MRLLLATAAVLAVATPAFAVPQITLALGGIVKPGQGLVSGRAVPLITEQFNTDANPGVCVPPPSIPNTGNPAIPAGIQVLGQVNNALAYVTGSVPNRNLAPAANSSCYLTLPFRNRIGNTQVNFRRRPSTQTVKYAGFMVGSLDEYNQFGAQDEGANLLQIEDYVDSQGRPRQISGQELATRFGIPLYAAYFIEMRVVDTSVDFAGFFLGSVNWAIETDNYAFSYTVAPLSGVNSIKRPRSARMANVDGIEALVVPAPATAALLLGGLGLVAALRLRRK